jgi:flavorubredoxin
MEKVELKPGIYWVGGIDWNLRDFHGYMTPRGSTYNAYLIVDEKIVLVDTVKHYMFDEMLARIKAIIDPSRIDIIVSNHVEMDHSGSLPKLLAIAPNATVVTSPQGEKGLKRHYKKDWNFKVVESGDVLNIGKRNLHFVHIPMVHWPDSMVTYIPEEKILLSNDAFGQHIATSERWDSQIDWGIAREEAAKYYANIVMPFGTQVKKALEVLSGLKIDIIAPSHGLMWKKHIPDIMAEYKKWCNYEHEEKALVIYDTMWGSTEKMANKIAEGLYESGISVRVYNLKYSDISDIMTHVLTAKYILIGSPTLNNGMMPTIGAFLTYVKGLKPRKKIGLAFGSYGWSGQAAGMIEDEMKTIGWEVPIEKLRMTYIPDENELDELKITVKKWIENVGKKEE